jgi:hypothetical protein
MLKNYILYNVLKNKKANSCGFWKAESGKIYIDKIEKISLNGEELHKAKKALFASGEKAVFYTDFQTAIIENEKGEKTYLKHCIKWNEKNLRPSLFKALILQHGGFTVTRGEKSFSIELWKE